MIHWLITRYNKHTGVLLTCLVAFGKCRSVVVAAEVLRRVKVVCILAAEGSIIFPGLKAATEISSRRALSLEVSQAGRRT